MNHTTGDVLGTISTPGLERAAHYFEYVVRKIDEAPTRQDHALAPEWTDASPYFTTKRPSARRSGF